MESKVAEKMGSRKGHGAAEYPQRIEDTINGRTYERYDFSSISKYNFRQTIDQKTIPCFFFKD